ncbi:hypothetical protein ACFYUK_34925 [Nonomuraea wenchangensis]
MQRALGGELVEKGTGAALVETGGARGAQDVIQIAGAVKTFQPLLDRPGQAGHHDGAQGVHAVLKGLLVAEYAPEGGLHSGPHGGKIGMPEHDPEDVPRRLWITPSIRAPPAAIKTAKAPRVRSPHERALG